MTPLQEELGLAYYLRLARAWRMRLVYAQQGMQFVPRTVPDSYFHDRSSDDD